jgi:hypothetical protein
MHNPEHSLIPPYSLLPRLTLNLLLSLFLLTAAPQDIRTAALPFYSLLSTAYSIPSCS